MGHRALSMALGQAIREARQQAGLTQQQVAAQAGMDRAFLSDVERGRVVASVESLFRISKAIGIKASTIVARVERSLP